MVLFGNTQKTLRRLHKIKNNRQRYIFKIHSKRLRDARWDLNLTLDDARENDEVIALAESSVIRFIDELKNINSDDIYIKISDIRKELKYYKKQKRTSGIKDKILELYTQIDELQFIPEYLCIVVDRNSDYRRACNGFTLNGLTYKRLLGTTGGIKNSTIVFIAEQTSNGVCIRDEIRRRLDNGRDLNKPLVPAKFEAYKALACSASIPVSDPKGIIVVNDCVTHFKSDYILLNDEHDGEPVMTKIENGEVELEDSDGFGLISPKLAERWSLDLGEKTSVSGFCIRNAFCKGMVFPFDYIDFGNCVANNYIITDAWGTKRDVRDADLILTTSMVKLWDSYENIEDYLYNCKKNHYSFSITKICDPEERNSRELNYQFIQSYKLTKEEIAELVQPTLDDICGVLGGDFYKTILFLKGSKQNESAIDSYENDYAKALMINPKVVNDPHLRDRVSSMIQKRTDNAKLGRVRVNGDFSVISGDPYSLCQSMFGLQVTGLLKAGQVYSLYWIQRNTPEVVCFRAPMSCHNNIRKVTVFHNDKCDYWYRYMKNVLILNSWDMITHACNGADKDGDTILTTNNHILLKNTLNSPAIVCIQRKAQKTIITEEILIEANISSFGDSIGSITNKVTSMFDVQSKYNPEDIEYSVLDYRIMCGQLYQQNAIDATKGIVAKPMPKYWYNAKKAAERDDEFPTFYKHALIVAAKKPYFMNYRYRQQKANYNNFMKVAISKARRNYNTSFNDLLYINKNEEYINWFYSHIPIENGECIMNICCKYIEDYIASQKNVWFEATKTFDYSIYKSIAEYSKYQYEEVAGIYNSYHEYWEECVAEAKSNHIDFKQINEYKPFLLANMKKALEAAVSDEYALCNIMLDLTYGCGKGNQIVWDVCGGIIIKNLLNNSNGEIIYLKQDKNGEIEYSGDTYSIKKKVV